MEAIKAVISKDQPISDEKHVLDFEKAEAVVSKTQEENPLFQVDPVISNISKTVLADDYAGVKVEDDSPYPEVRAAIPSSDDPTLPHNTIRAWVIGMIMSTVLAALNMFFSLRSPSFSVSVYVASLLAWPLGMGWYKIMPNISIFGLPLNPGPFNLKEHTLITIMANVSYGVAYVTDILLAMNNFYGVNFGWGFNILAMLSTQCIGLCLGGMSRKVLVEPPSMIWPSNLVTATFLTNIHINDNHPANGWTISRFKFFALVFIGSFVWYWFPGYIFQALSYFAWVTWIRPNNVKVNQVFGASTGLGLLPITFDWNQIAGYIGSPLIPPASAVASILFSMVVIFWFVVPIVHFKNSWYGMYLPISDSNSYDRYQSVYNVSKIVNKDLSFNEEAYKSYSPLYLSTTFAISYGMSFASITATVVHFALFFSKDTWNQLRNREKKDVHNRLMQNYKEAPDWWYAVGFLIFFGVSIGVVRGWNTEMPVYALIVALLIAIFFLFPVGIIAAITNVQVGLNVITEFIIGYMVPGKPISMMFFKTFGYITNAQALTFISDMKLGHYMKIAPRVLFIAQFVATIWSGIVQVAVLKWAQGSIDNICNRKQKNHFTCPNGRVFFNASIIWGVIGPARQFSSGKLYNQLMYFFLVGAGLPVINWLVLKKWPNSPIKWLNWPVFFTGTGYIPPATPYNYGAYCFFGLFFNWFIKKKFFSWWSKYNYSLSAGLDIGLAWSSLIIFLTLTLTNTDFPSWWGNDVVNSTMDTQGTAINYVLNEGDAFGLTSW